MPREMQASSPPTAREVAEVLLDPERRSRLFAYAASRFGIGTDNAEDLLQETALELLRYRSYVRNPEGFVFTVFRARCVRFIDSRRRGRERAEDLADGPGTPAGGSEDLEQRVALREALGAVSSSCRRLLSAYYVEGQSLREAAKTLSLAYSSVGKTISRCLRRLRECIS